MRKTLLRLFAVTIAASGLAACASEPMTTQEATRWIAAYTPEQIDMASRIRIEATDSLLARLDTLRPLEKAFRFSPPRFRARPCMHRAVGISNSAPVPAP